MLIQNYTTIFTKTQKQENKRKLNWLRQVK
jgi:hypothetical protein